MIENVPPVYLNLFLLIISFLINIPMGYVRENFPKFSFKWFLWIHASIPILVYLRIAWHTAKILIPVTIFFAVIGQIVGSRMRKKNMTEEEKERLLQIPDLNAIPKEKIEGKKVLIALLNMGGPLKTKNVKSFQEHLFNDARLIRFPLSFLLQKIFAKILITFRLKAVEERYDLIGGGSPIYPSTIAQARALRKELKRRGLYADVTFSFNYSPPFPDDTLKKALRAKKTHLLPLSLYPHYSSATTGSNIYYLKDSAKKIYPDIQFLHAPAYYLHDGYIQAFAERINQTLKATESLDDFFILFSAHGLPMYYLVEGDPYPFQIAETVAQILAKLKRTKDWVLAYQSAVGPFEWLKPGTEEMLHVLAKRGIKKILVVPVSFVGDHIETICEIDIEYRAIADKLGISDYRMSKAIECHPGFINALADSAESLLFNSESNLAKNDKLKFEMSNL